MRPHRWQPTRLLRPWDFPSKSTGVGCHCLLRGDAQMVKNVATVFQNEALPLSSWLWRPWVCSIRMVCSFLRKPSIGPHEAAFCLDWPHSPLQSPPWHVPVTHTLNLSSQYINRMTAEGHPRLTTSEDMLKSFVSLPWHAPSYRCFQFSTRGRNHKPRKQISVSKNCWKETPSCYLTVKCPTWDFH